MQRTPVFRFKSCQPLWCVSHPPPDSGAFAFENLMLMRLVPISSQFIKLELGQIVSFVFVSALSGVCSQLPSKSHTHQHILDQSTTRFRLGTTKFFVNKIHYLGAQSCSAVLKVLTVSICHLLLLVMKV